MQGATFDVRRGTITGLIGPNGAGKSTVINLISGRTKPARGSVRFGGAEITGQRPHEVARHGIVRTFQQANVFGGLTVLENLLVGAPPWRGESIAAALGPKRAWAGREAELVEQARGLLRRFGLEGIADEYAKVLSGGQRRLVEIMRALMARPKLLLLDEPMAGVSPSLALSIADRLIELRDEGMTMLLDEPTANLAPMPSARLLSRDVPALAAAGVTVILVGQRAVQAIAISDWVYLLVGGAVELQRRARDMGASSDFAAAFLGAGGSRHRAADSAKAREAAGEADRNGEPLRHRAPS